MDKETELRKEHQEKMREYYPPWCKFRRYIRKGDQVICEDYNCDELREKHESFKKQFRIENGSDYVPRDLAYERFAKEIDDVLKKCQCEKRREEDK